ncbi:MAG TPA: hypothetical protein VLV83_06080 [Acidobacteriota bacterium]|nr:hypothetical protein [Acidobacteriota bacterium]
MLAFRSEGEVHRWCRSQDLEPGAIFPPSTLWKLAQSWYDDRLDLHWKRRSPEQRQQLLRNAGLTGDFWQMQSPPDSKK